MVFRSTITDEAALRAIYREPSPLVARKAISHVDEAAAAFVAASPFVVVATGSPAGYDASPRGGPPGFVRVLDPRHLAFGDLAGNNRLDSFRNLLAHPAIGLLFLVPGVDETLRVNGRAVLTTDDDVRAACAIDGKVPKVAIGVEVEECFVHCAKAFRRSGLWRPETWPAPERRPSAACAFVAHLQLDVAPELVDRDLEEGYRLTMWEVGGG